jgi:hypothetical protein
MRDPSGHDGIADILVTMGIGESLDSSGDEADIAGGQAARRLLRSKQFDVYIGLSRGGLSQGSAVFIPHAFLYVANKEFQSGLSFDVANSGLITKAYTVSQEKAQSLFLYQIAQFSALQYVEWSASAYIIADIDKNSVSLPQPGVTWWEDIEQAFSFTFWEGTVNCYKFTALAALDALATARLPI